VTTRLSGGTGCSGADRREVRAAPRGVRLLIAGIIAAAAGLVALPIGTAGVAGAATGTTAGTTYYAIGKPVCKPPKAGHFACFAVRRVEVKKGTPGALAYRVAGGVEGAAAAVTTGPKATIGPAGGLTPSDFATAYGFSSTATGTGQTVAVVDAFNDPDINADLQTFDTQYGLLTCSTGNGCLTVVGQTGTSALPPNDTTGWSLEETLDVETVHSVCQNCKILLVETTNSSDANLEAGVDEAVALHATEISNSYGGPEAGSTAAEEAAYNHPGTVITASSGDDGYFDFDFLGSRGIISQPNAPASYNSVVSVGGTSLYLGQTAARQSESVWNDNGTKDYDESLFGENFGAGGGGCSKLIAAKPWQSAVSDWVDTVCGTHRLVADVSADADYLTGIDIYDTFNCGPSCSPPVPGWLTIGGTSLSSPLIAAMFGLAGGSHGVAYPSLTLYGHLGSASLYNVTSGGNGFCGGEGAAACGDPNLFGEGVLDCDYPATGSTPSVGDLACDAQAGYNGPTGVGTPNGLGAFAKTGPSAVVGGPTSIAHATAGTWTATTSDPFPGGTVKTFSWNWGDGTAATVTTTGTASHTYATGGVSHTITLTVTDNYGQKGTATHPVAVS
jgi:hypothetical protein